MSSLIQYRLDWKALTDRVTPPYLDFLLCAEDGMSGGIKRSWDPG